MFGEKEYLKALLEGKMIEVVNKPVILDPEVFTPRKGILTRYGKSLLNNNYYKTLIRVNVDEMAADMQTILNEQRDKELRKYRSIDDEWEPSDGR